jgi:hypothetical protein
VRRLIEEDELKPMQRGRIALAKRRWRTANHTDAAKPLFIAGVQRSGTNLVGRLLNEYPEVEFYNENRRAAFDRFLLKPDPVIRRLIKASRHQIVAFKPLCDSHRIPHLLDTLDESGAAQALWVYRSVDDRARSAVAKFGTNNLDALREVAAGGGSQRWQAQGLSEVSRDFLQSLDFSRLSAHSGAALLWYLRNSMYFEHGLDQRDDVLLVSYDGLVDDPPRLWDPICRFLGLDYRDEVLQRHPIRRPSMRPALDLDASVRSRCSDLMRRLNAAALRSEG